ncbi:DUF5709 domain-containing protein [Actinacidiphila acididurans]|uniref:DUF5709 domain-containing protein n=1 Tax=Actinacidiphila acididurans TaxID=2784346 RepID=A0ABS2U3X2_9ACTN|nr:DUF5709 domain-containing protein [Actinacidiphila acididurans]MBM9510319.1 hypothetical protein [Actinacidiphila acididurans]
MTDDAMGDEVYEPTDGNEEQEDAAPLDLEDALDEDDLDDALDKGWSPPERPLGVDKVGTTAAEQHRGESLDERLAEEVPDEAEDDGDGLGDNPDSDGELTDPEAGSDRSGRLLSPDHGAESNTDDTVATDVGIDGAAASAEEAAVHRVADPEHGDEET